MGFKRRRTTRNGDKRRQDLKKARHFMSGDVVSETKIGDTRDDYTIRDCYDFKSLQPWYRDEVVIPKRFRDTKVKPLKFLASKALAQNHSQLTSSLLKIGVWQTWCLVWELILINEWDTPRVFESFAKSFETALLNTHFFGKRSKFLTNDLRNDSIESNTLRHKNHRLEVLSWNSLHFPDCLHNSGFQNLVILDLSSLRNQEVLNDKSLYLKLTNIKSLALLNCNGVRTVDPAVINSWCISIKLGKWSQLSMICLRDTNIDQLALTQLMSLHSRLYYIETSTTTQNERWDQVELSTHIRDHTSLKYHYISKNLRPQFMEPEQGFIMDYKILSEPWDCKRNDNEFINYKLHNVWSQRQQRQVTSTRFYAYVLYKKELVTPQQSKTTTPKRKLVKSFQKYFDL